MNIFGFYPFIVHVANMFDPLLKADFEVEHYQHRTYNTQLENIGGSIITEMTSSNGKSNLSIHSIDIPGGHCIAFPMQFGDEKVKISLRDSSKINYSYRIAIGVKALCRVTYFSIPGDKITLPEEDMGVEFTPSCFEGLEPFSTELEKLNEPGGDFHVGGVWQIPGSFNYGWVLEIRKHNFDPEDVSVPIGTQTPG